MRKELRTTYSPWQLFPYVLIFFILSLFSQKQPISISSINNYSVAEKIAPKKFKNPPVIEGFKKSEQPSKPDDVLQKQISKEQSDIFQSMPNSSSSMTGYSTGSKSKQITIEEETAGTGIRTTSSFLILDENGMIQNTWLWSVEETIETTDSIYSDTLVQFHEYVEDLR